MGETKNQVLPPIYWKTAKQYFNFLKLVNPVTKFRLLDSYESLVISKNI